jgi:hypothetical protein
MRTRWLVMSVDALLNIDGATLFETCDTEAEALLAAPLYGTTVIVAVEEADLSAPPPPPISQPRSRP